MPSVTPFIEALETHAISFIRGAVSTLQVNVGKYCNQACLHCHVEAGPTRTEKMDAKTAEQIIYLLKRSPSINTLDITGGAPELSAVFRPLVLAGRALGLKVIDRCNLTVIFEAGQKDLVQFLANNSVHVIASLPCYTKENVERQRGGGIFQKSIDALRVLNEHGYGIEGSPLLLDLVYNPIGATLPPPELKLEQDYKRELLELFGITFNRLYTITNIPINRFLHQLVRDGKLEAYMSLLVENFNPQAAKTVMCRTLLSVDWRGQLYDCDFNQMLELPLAQRSRTIWELDTLADVSGEPIAAANHCYACTAGAGSSCCGTLTS